jgi:hypothetical protein
MPFFPRRLPAHAEGIAVREAERESGDESLRPELRVDRREVEVLVALQHLARDRAGVLGIRIDGAARKRLVEDRGVAEAGAMDRLRARALHALREDLAEDVRLGEALGADAKRLLGGRGRREEER